MTETDIAYCAGLIDGEGCVRVKRSKPYRHLTGRVNPAYGVSIQVRMVDEGAIKFLCDTLGGWYWREKKPQKGRKQLYCWQATDSIAESILKSILPYSRVKTSQIENALALRTLQSRRKEHKTKITGYRNFPNQHGAVRQVPNLAYSDEYIAQCEGFFQRARQLNQVGV